MAKDLAARTQMLEKKLPKIQKIIIIGVLVASILVFLYSFILMTPFADLYEIDGQFLFTRMTRFWKASELEKIIETLPPEAIFVSPISEKAVGVNLAYFTSMTRNELQVFNHWVFALGFFGIIASLLPLVYFSQKRKIYYKTNLVVVPAVATFNLYIGVHMFVQLVMNHMMVMSDAAKTGYDVVNAYETYLADPSGESSAIKTFYRQSDSNFVFILGYVIALLVIGFAIACYVLTITKYRYQKSKEQVDLSKIQIQD